MKDRIKAIMDSENMTPTRFADTLQVGRAVISHILNGRNNPSLDVVTRILSEMPYINSDWLITGNGTMHKSDNEIKNGKSFFDDEINSSSSSSRVPNLFEQDLFSQNSVNTSVPTDKSKYQTENELNSVQNERQNVINERIIYREKPDKKISRIIIYYSDNTYEIFEQGK